MSSQARSRGEHIKWKQCTSMPVSWYRPQAVMINDSIYVGGGIAEKKKMLKMHKYNLSEGTWRYVTRTPVALYGMGYFQDRIITVGGTSTNGLIVRSVYSFEETTRLWEECIKKMPTARASLSVLTTTTCIVACGGTVWKSGQEPVPCATVEVYSSDTEMWHKADPLPHPCATMSSTRIGDIFFLLGEVLQYTTKGVATNNTICVDIEDLITGATSQTLKLPQQQSLWSKLPGYPLVGAGAASLSGVGALLAIGGHDADTQPHIYVLSESGWKRLEGCELPAARGGPTAMEVSCNRVMVFGGEDFEGDITDTVYEGVVGS